MNKDNKNNYYKVLGIKKNSSRDDIVKAYKIHYLKYKDLGPNKTKEQEEEFKQIEKAYNELMGYNYIEDLQEKKQKPVFEFLGIDQEKFENFWMYNKTKIFVAIFVIIMIITYISQMANRPQYDLNVVFAGNFKMTDEYGIDKNFNTEIIKTDVKNRFDFIKELLVSYYKQDMYADETEIAENQIFKQKFVVELANGMIDILILDRATFNYYASKGFLMDLADFSDENNIEYEKRETAVFVDNKGNKFNSVYGIDILTTDFCMSNRIRSGDGEIIACIAANSRKTDNARKVLSALAG